LRTTKAWWWPVRSSRQPAKWSPMRHYEWLARCVVRTRRPGVPTRVTTPGSSWPICASTASLRTLPRTSLAAVNRRSMAARPATRAMPNRSTPASKSSRCLAGSNSRLACGCSKVGAVFRLHLVAYNLIRITNLFRTQTMVA